jgi:hypothetical protein
VKQETHLPEFYYAFFIPLFRLLRLNINISLRRCFEGQYCTPVYEKSFHFLLCLSLLP